MSPPEKSGWMTCESIVMTGYPSPMWTAPRSSMAVTPTTSTMGNAARNHAPQAIGFDMTGDRRAHSNPPSPPT
jgi:hypothetical protein